MLAMNLDETQGRKFATPRPVSTFNVLIKSDVKLVGNDMITQDTLNVREVLILTRF